MAAAGAMKYISRWIVAWTPAHHCWLAPGGSAGSSAEPGASLGAGPLTGARSLRGTPLGTAKVRVATVAPFTATSTTLVMGTWLASSNWLPLLPALLKAVTASPLVAAEDVSSAAWAALALKKSSASATHAKSATRATLRRRSAGRRQRRLKPKSFSSARTNV